MVSSCLEANKSMAHSELIQVWGHHAVGTSLCRGHLAVPWGPCRGDPHRALQLSSPPRTSSIPGAALRSRASCSCGRPGARSGSVSTSPCAAQGSTTPPRAPPRSGCGWDRGWGGTAGLVLTCPPPPQDPRHLQYFADLTESNIYYVTQGKKLYGTPTEFGFCIKVGMSLPT